MVVTRNDMIPLFHHTYQGNMADAKVFSAVLETIKDRMTGLGFDSKKHTIVFDRGNNSMDNMAIVERLALHYVGALTPYHHKQLVGDAMCNFREYDVDAVRYRCTMTNGLFGAGKNRCRIYFREIKGWAIKGICLSLWKRQNIS